MLVTVFVQGLCKNCSEDGLIKLNGMILDSIFPKSI